MKRTGVIVASVVAGVASVAAPASAAATPGVVLVVASEIVRYNAGNQAHNVVFTRSGRTVTVDDVVAIRAGAGCSAVSGDRTKVRCTTPVEPLWVQAFLGDRNDTVVNRTDLAMSADGGNGNDRITGGPRGDRLRGSDGNDAIWGLGGDDYLSDQSGTNALSGGDGDDSVFGGEGNDRIYGGNGNDTINGYVGNDIEDGGPGDDVFSQNADPWKSDADAFVGGSGFDTVSYELRAKPVAADPDAVKGDDGAAGEHDTLGTSIEAVTGGRGNDRLIGSVRDEEFRGGPGNDVIAAGGGDDHLWGDSGNDYLNGASGSDTVNGGPGSDTCIPDAADTFAECEK
ncbi:calcium-binding protein [Actinoplanes sp. LDG1-06]|uniref:Calcium-binding protein n=1 Tax=Paractinoplanes ovalisporus TaxID=2810368 RepID=A0ABS2ABD3_9ACTN|nr:calcium-binding protein [Actinoplanes ovalisporus]MBM2617132.1 calcium-binding protein [Actinoplanes ovalisporus]